MQVCGQEFSPALIERINATMKKEPALSRRELSRRVCGWLEWTSANGQLKDVSARVALKRLAQRGVVALPPLSNRPAPRRHPAGRGEPSEVSTPAQVLTLEALGPVELVLVSEPDSELSLVWRTLMRKHHPLGDGPLCGAQLRYLIRSREHSWLGGLAFSAPAWRVAARDAYIGWSERARVEQLSLVVCNSRFLITPQVQVPHLASHVLGQVRRRLRADWSVRYGYEPVLMETYVEPERYRGTCYRASNWRRVGCTTGRGRQDRERCAALSVKDVYVYPLVRNWRQRLCAEAPVAPVRIETSDWAEEEFARVHLGDKRLERRVLTVARDLYARPQSQLPQACQTQARTKAAYRLFDHRRVTLDSLLDSHVEATAARVAEHPVVLAVQDSTSLNYTAHPMTEGLGPLNTTADQSVGLWMHDTMAFTPQGVPLGLLDVQCWARDPAKQGQRATRHRRGIKDKESVKWLNSFERACVLQGRCAETTVVSVGDRESDVYELLVRAKRPGAAKLLIRAERSRRMVEEHGSLWDFMAGEPVAGTQVLEVPRRHHRARREARLDIRFTQVTLKAPQRKRDLGAVRLWAVWAHECDPPEGVEALDWMLLTTVAVNDFEEALERLAWYRRRWGIEVYHRTLKSGCRIEERQLGAAERIEGCLAIDLVVTWRIYHLTMLGRETPDVPCSVYFKQAQWKALVAFVRQQPMGGSRVWERRCDWWRGSVDSWVARATAIRAPRVCGWGFNASTTSLTPGPCSMKCRSRENSRYPASMIMGNSQAQRERAIRLSAILQRST